MLFVSRYSFVCLHCDRSCTIEEAPSPWITWQDKFRGTRWVSVVMKENSFRFWYAGATNAVGVHRALGACWDCDSARQMHEVSVFFLFPPFIFLLFIFLHSHAEEAGDGGVWVRWMQAVNLLSSFSGRLGHEMGAAELAQRYPAWLEGCHCFGGNRSFPEISFWRSEDGLDWDPAWALRRYLLFLFILFCNEWLASGCFRQTLD